MKMKTGNEKENGNGNKILNILQWEVLRKCYECYGNIKNVINMLHTKLSTRLP